MDEAQVASLLDEMVDQCAEDKEESEEETETEPHETFSSQTPGDASEEPVVPPLPSLSRDLSMEGSASGSLGSGGGGGGSRVPSSGLGDEDEAVPPPTTALYTIAGSGSRDRGSSDGGELGRRRSIRESMTEAWIPQHGSPLEDALAAYGQAANKATASGKPKIRSSILKRTSTTTSDADARATMSVNVSGNEITESHKQYALTYAMMLGIRTTISAPSEEVFLDPQRDATHLSPADFQQIDKFVFRPEGQVGTFCTPPHKLPHKFIFKDYCPKVYRQLRRYHGISEEDYMLSICGDFHFIEFMTNSKSGEWFFYSGDAKYMIKTMSKEESKFMRVLLPRYFEHVRNNPHTFINPFFGMHRVQMSSFGHHVYFMVLGSVFDTELPVHVMYDLKGSSQGREISEEDKAKGKVRKDNNLIEDGEPLHLGPLRGQFLEQVERDTKFLAEMRCMDYSLLVGIHQRATDVPVPLGRRFSSVRGDPPALAAMLSADQRLRLMQSISEDMSSPVPVTSPFKGDQGGLRAQDADGNDMPMTYLFGIIDILQTYTRLKRAETFFKSLNANRASISCVDPDFYARRFNAFMTDHSA